MFTGIVQGAYPIAALQKKAGLQTFTIELPAALTAGLAIGASVAVNGVCLTVTDFDDRSASFDVMQQTLDLTTMGVLSVGDRVNIERSASYGKEVGGHILSGHIDATAEIIAIERPANNCFVTYLAPLPLVKYIFDKGFVALDGCSLTVAGVDPAQGHFRVCYIPETLRSTVHGHRQVGERVNLEIDRQTQAIVDTVEQFLTRSGAALVPAPGSQ